MACRGLCLVSHGDTSNKNYQSIKFKRIDMIDVTSRIFSIYLFIIA